VLPTLVGSYFTVLQCKPVKLIAKDICRWWLGICRYAGYRRRSSTPGELSRLSSYRWYRA